MEEIDTSEGAYQSNELCLVEQIVLNGSVEVRLAHLDTCEQSSDRTIRLGKGAYLLSASS